MANEKTVKARQRQKTDTTANWDKATTFVPLKGEMIVYQDANASAKLKIGDGVTLLKNLDFVSGGLNSSDIDTTLTGSGKAAEAKAVGNAINALDTRIVNLGNSVDGISTKANSHDSSISDLNQRVGAVQNTVANHDPKITKNIEDIADLSEDVTDLLDRLRIAENGIFDLRADLDNLEIPDYPDLPENIDAASLGGISAENYATKTYVGDEIIKAQLAGSGVDTSLLVTKEELFNFRVVAGNTGEKIGNNATVEGQNNSATGVAAHAEGEKSSADADFSHAEGTSIASADYAHSEGSYTAATGYASHAEGESTVASGQGSHAEGSATSALGVSAHAEGLDTYAGGQSSHAEGYGSEANGYASHAEGEYSGASGRVSHAEGYGLARADGSHAEGSGEAYGTYSHAEGYGSFTYGDYSHSEGVGSFTNFQITGAANATTYSGTQKPPVGSVVRHNNTFAVVTGSSSRTFTVDKTLSATELNNDHAIMYLGIAYGEASHVEGTNSQAIGEHSHAEGCETLASGACSHAEGRHTNAWGWTSHAEGAAEGLIPSSITLDSTNEQIISAWSDASWNDEAFALAKGATSHIEGYSNLALGNYSHAEGAYTRATGTYSHAEGYSTQANGDNSHTEGWYTIASGSSSHAEGGSTKATGTYSHAEGSNNTAAGRYSHAEGGYSLASADYDHAEGYSTIAAGSAAHAEGYRVCALGNYSHAEGYGSITQSIKITGSANATQYSVNSTKDILVGTFIQTTDLKNWATITSVDTVNKTIQVDKTLSADTAFSNSMVNIHLSGLAMGEGAHLEGLHTIANDDYQHVQGKYNVTGPYAHIIGNGTALDARANAHTIDWSGNAWYAGIVKVGGTAYDDAKELATKEYVDQRVATGGGGSSDGIFIEDTAYPGCFYRLVDGEKEWLNPPMFSNTAYRTVERYDGRPVWVGRNYYDIVGDIASGYGISFSNIDEESFNYNAQLIDVHPYFGSGWETAPYYHPRDMAATEPDPYVFYLTVDGGGFTYLNFDTEYNESCYGGLDFFCQFKFTYEPEG